MHVERLGELHHLSWVAILRAVPEIGRRMKKVPEDFWDVVTSQEAIIRCPCGQVNTVAPASAAQCGCGRLYLWARSSMWAAKP